jgi:hypothetical protein
METISPLDELEIRLKIIDDVLKQLKTKPILSVIDNLENVSMYLEQMRNYILKETRELRNELAEKEEENAIQAEKLAELRRLLQQAGIDIPPNLK